MVQKTHSENCSDMELALKSLQKSDRSKKDVADSKKAMAYLDQMKSISEFSAGKYKVTGKGQIKIN